MRRQMFQISTMLGNVMPALPVVKVYGGKLVGEPMIHV